MLILFLQHVGALTLAQSAGWSRCVGAQPFPWRRSIRRPLCMWIVSDQIPGEHIYINVTVLPNLQLFYGCLFPRTLCMHGSQ